MSQPPLPGTTPPRRHPSSADLTGRPELSSAADPLPALPPITFPVGEPSEPALRLGPELDEETATRLVGNIEAKRVLELGCGSGANAIALALRGAKVIVVDPSLERLTRARRNAEEHNARIEFHHGDLADLAFIRADQVDLCLAIYSLATITDVSRVFRQVHRVQRTEAPFVISLPHPSIYSCELGDGGPPHLVRAADDPTPIAWPLDWPDEPDLPHAIVPHRISEMLTNLTRSNFRVDMLMETMDDTGNGRSTYRSELQMWVPASFVIRGRKQGI